MKNYSFRLKSDNYVTIVIFANSKKQAFDIIKENQLYFNKDIKKDWMYVGSSNNDGVMYD